MDGEVKYTGEKEADIMYVINGIAYAGEPTPVIKVSGIRPLDDYRLWIRFSTGEEKQYYCISEQNKNHLPTKLHCITGGLSFGAKGGT